MSHIIAESNDDFSHKHFELKNFILAQKLEKKATNEGRPLIGRETIQGRKLVWTVNDVLSRSTPFFSKGYG